jgi:hypothetical protein
MQFANANANATWVRYASRSIGANVAEVIVGFAFYMTQLPWSGDALRGQLVSFIDSATKQCEVRVNSSGQIAAYNASGTLVGTSAETLPLNSTYVFIEVRALIHASAGQIEVRVNGAVWLNLTGLDTLATANVYCNVITFGNFTGMGTGTTQPILGFRVDDLYIIDGDDNSDGLDDFIGDHSIRAFLPTGDGDELDWARGGADSGSDSGQIDETTANSDTDYLTTSTPTDQHLSTYGDLSVGTIKAVVITPFARKDNGGATTLLGLTKSGGTIYQTADSMTLTTGYQLGFLKFVENPDTSAPWTITEFNNAQFGFEASA